MQEFNSTGNFIGSKTSPGHAFNQSINQPINKPINQHLYSAFKISLLRVAPGDPGQAEEKSGETDIWGKPVHVPGGNWTKHKKERLCVVAESFQDIFIIALWTIILKYNSEFVKFQLDCNYCCLVGSIISSHGKFTSSAKESILEECLLMAKAV